MKCLTDVFDIGIVACSRISGIVVELLMARAVMESACIDAPHVDNGRQELPAMLSA